MRILIDLQGAQTESRFRGIGRYSLSIAQAIARNAGEHEVWLLLNGAFLASVPAIRRAFKGLVPPERIQVFQVPMPVAEHTSGNAWRARAAEHIRQHFISSLAPDMVLVTSLFEGYVDDAVTTVPERDPGYATAAILYDLIPLLHPETYLTTDTQRIYYDRKIASLKRADLLLSISRYSRTEALDVLDLPEERIVNVSTAVDARFVPTSYPEHARNTLSQRLGIHRAILMYAPGGFDSRKNFEALIQAFAALDPALRKAYQLVIVSKVGFSDSAILRKAARDAGLEADELVLTGYVDDADLVMLYNIATLFVFPSLHEGFGLPVLEAMACGAAVIGSNTTSVPEVIGNPDALFDPSSVAAISAKLADMLGSPEKRAVLRERGLVHAATFSWDRIGCAALAGMEQLYAKRARPSEATGAEPAYRALLQQVAAAYRYAPRADDNQLRMLADVISRNVQHSANLLRSRELPARISWRIEGPFDSSYSLALLNRETALALDQLGHDVALHSTEGPGDFVANPDFLRNNPEVARLHQRVQGMLPEMADVSSRNLYPPRVADMHSPLNMLHHYAWEESGFPQAWADDFNTHLQGMTCLSTHVQKIMVDQGVTVPMSTSGCGVDHWERVVAVQYPVQARGFRFVHVSSCFPRKGADVLLRAYGAAFTAADDVTLVIKTFANPHNEIHTWLAAARAGNPAYPDVVIIEEDLQDAQLKGLLEACHALVAPSRAEGFGMPLAEAMLSGLPVITTGWSGQLDFCSAETAWLVDFSFAPAQTHFNLFGSVWAEPSERHLAATMREVHDMAPAARQARVDRARAVLLEQFTWRGVAGRLVDSARTFAGPLDRQPQKIGWISTWNTKCGIATYSAHLLHSIEEQVTVLAARTDARIVEDGPEALRCWDAGEMDPLVSLAEEIDKAGITTLVLQFNYGFFHLERLGEFLMEQRKAGRVIVVMLHATIDPVHAEHKRLALLVPALRQCQRLLVHSPADLNRLKDHGLLENVTLFPHGVLDWQEPAPRPVSDVFTLASYGFFLPHKGLPQLVEALGLLVAQGRNVRLKMINAEYPVGESAALIADVRSRVEKLELGERVEFATDFLEDVDSLARLGEADLIVFPYQNTGESSSGAVRYGMACGRPVAVTPLSIFDDVRRAAFALPGQSPEDIARGLGELIDAITVNAPHVEQLRTEAARWREAHRYSRLGERLLNMTLALHRADRLSLPASTTLQPDLAA